MEGFSKIAYFIIDYNCKILLLNNPTDFVVTIWKNLSSLRKTIRIVKNGLVKIK